MTAWLSNDLHTVFLTWRNRKIALVCALTTKESIRSPGSNQSVPSKVTKYSANSTLSSGRINEWSQGMYAIDNRNPQTNTPPTFETRCHV